MSHHKKIFLVLVPALVALDQLTKVIVRAKLPEGDRIPIIPRFFDFVHAENTGAAFSILQHSEYRLVVFSVVTMAAFVVIGVVYRSLQADQRATAAALCLIFAGAMGNFIDRLVFHSVTDFLEFYLLGDGGRFLIKTVGTNRWPAFNVADMAIVGGVGLFLVESFKIERALAREHKDPTDAEDAPCTPG